MWYIVQLNVGPGGVVVFSFVRLSAVAVEFSDPEIEIFGRHYQKSTSRDLPWKVIAF